MNPRTVENHGLESHFEEFIKQKILDFFLSRAIFFLVNENISVISQILEKALQSSISLLQMSITSFKCSIISKPKYDAEL